MRSNEIEDGNDYAVGDLPGHRLRWRVTGREQIGTSFRLIAFPVDLDGNVTGQAQSLTSRSFTSTWEDEQKVRDEQEREAQKRREELTRERAERQARVTATLPAFRGIKVSPRMVGRFGGLDDEEPTLDLADALEEIYNKRDSNTCSVTAEVFELISARIKQLSQELQGSTWVTVPDAS
jgi:hypothetical protein